MYTIYEINHKQGRSEPHRLGTDAVPEPHRRRSGQEDALENVHQIRLQLASQLLLRFHHHHHHHKHQHQYIQQQQQYGTPSVVHFAHQIAIRSIQQRHLQRLFARLGDASAAGMLNSTCSFFVCSKPPIV